MKITYTKTSLLDAKPYEEGFIVGNYDDPMMYAAVPVAGIKVSRNRQSAIAFIDKHKKRRKK